jgi:SAM-dependent methyltransferase
MTPSSFWKKPAQGTASGQPAGPSAGSLTPLQQPSRSQDLKAVSLVDLSAELLARLNSGEKYDSYVLLGEQLKQSLASVLDIHENRFSAKRYRDQFQPILRSVRPHELKGGTVVDLGCGSLNPFAFSFLCLMLGAERAYAIDIEPIQDLKLAVEAMATAAGWFLLDSTKILGADGIAPEEVLKNLKGFQLPLLAAGNPDGIASDRLEHRVESIYDLSFADGEVSAVFSVSVFEHLERPDDAIESLRRVTRPGGFGFHVVDFADHRIYADVYGLKNPFEFLKVDSFNPPERMHWSNRIRCDQVCTMFERNGFVVENLQVARTEAISEQEQALFVEPYRSMNRESLEIVVARILVRRV